ncbi:rhodanese-like domain-containing protein [Ectobacillus ponti]|uniref:Sulfurtransferase n=1 Tax=Ectobacillus ponti TaxID=2961894 RepID=A0AA41XC71_9BACI|nr:sulfurtransferase [Ectobacillus ponti]MCP8970208.1 sulfurtransferase [Ectobacillus ponti]
MFIVGILASFLAALVLYIRYMPVYGVQAADEARADILVLDVRDYNETSKCQTNAAVHIPYAYLVRFYQDIPKRPLHVVAASRLDRNLAIRFLRRRGYTIASYHITNGKGATKQGREVFHCGV